MDLELGETDPVLNQAAVGAKFDSPCLRRYTRTKGNGGCDGYPGQHLLQR